VPLHAHAEPILLGERREQLTPCDADVVARAAGAARDVDP
jgi:hypothetical protein